jgi:hypothetical protein
MKMYAIKRDGSVLLLSLLRRRCIPSVFLSFLIISSISGCATSNISEKAQLNVNDGILLTKVHSSLGGIKISVFGEETNLLPKVSIADDDYFKIEMLGMKAGPANQSVDYLRAVPVKGGRAYFGHMSRLDNYVTLEPQYFIIVPGTINYVGDIHIYWVAGWDGYILLEYVDAEEETIKEAKERFPWLFTKYRYVKNMTFEKGLFYRQLNFCFYCFGESS